MDAILLARDVAERQLVTRQPPPAEWSALQQLLARREDYLQMRHAERKRQAIFALHPQEAVTMRDSLQDTTQHLQHALDAIEAVSEELFRHHPPMPQHLNRLDLIPRRRRCRRSYIMQPTLRVPQKYLLSAARDGFSRQPSRLHRLTGSQAPVLSRPYVVAYGRITRQNKGIWAAGWQRFPIY